MVSLYSLSCDLYEEVFRYEIGGWTAEIHGKDAMVRNRTIFEWAVAKGLKAELPTATWWMFGYIAVHHKKMLCESCVIHATFMRETEQTEVTTSVTVSVLLCCRTG